MPFVWLYYKQETGMKTVILDKASLDKEDLDFSELSKLSVDCDIYEQTSVSETGERVKGAEIIISNKVFISKDVIDSAQNLKLICIAATGTNNVDLDYAEEKGVQVCNVRGYGTNSVTQHVFTALLMLMRSIPQYQRAIKNGDWQKSKEFCLLDYPIEDLTNKTFGIIGYGELGKGVAKIAEAFGMRVIVAAHNKTETLATFPLSELLSQSDVVSIHCPLTAETENLIDTKELLMMKPNAILINMARGGIVNERALAEALINKKIAGAAIDVLVKEPPESGSPLLQLNLPNLIITPHIAWASRTARQTVLNQVIQNIQNYISGGALINKVV